MQILAGIVLYNPHLTRLIENINAIGPQVDSIIFVDNGSLNKTEIENLLAKISYNHIVIINNSNMGIAYALNQIMEYGEKCGAEWVLTLDQDSVCPDNIILNFSRYLHIEKIGIICPVICDRCFGVIMRDDSAPYKYIDCCITSASLTNVIAWRRVGGFDNSMFIDGVDTDYCLTLKENGYQILQCMDVELLHELGHNSKSVIFWGHKQIVFHHSAFRYFFICRNIIYNNRKHRFFRASPIRALITIFYRWLLIMFFESNKWGKTISIIRGTLKGFIMEINNNK